MWSELGFAMGSVAWFVALVMGIHAIKVKKLDQHRRWMVMMAALNFGAVSFRLQFPILQLFFEKTVSSSTSAGAVGCLVLHGGGTETSDTS
jgi:uncharacterized membrane protein YozB (DUF420 family)